MVKKHIHKKENEGQSSSKQTILGVSALLIVLLVVSVITQGFGVFSCNLITGCAVKETQMNQEVVDDTLDFVNEVLLEGQARAQLINIVEESGTYRMFMNIEGEEADLYVTNDGNLIFFQPINVQEIRTAMLMEQEAPVQEVNVEYSQESLNNFAQCLTDAGAIFYGADWCGFCQQQKDLFGSAIEYLNHVECTIEQEVCQEAGVQAYPSWFINGEMQSGMKSLPALASLTGCSLE